MKPDGSDTHAWTVVLRPDGVVDDVQGGAPIHWWDTRCWKAVNVPEDGAFSRASGFSRPIEASLAEARARLDRDQRPAGSRSTLVVCDAVPLRRSLVIVRDMVMRVLELFRQQAPDTGVEVHLDYSEAVPLAFSIDGEKITWAISTLVGTALRHIRTGPTACDWVASAFCSTTSSR